MTNNRMAKWMMLTAAAMIGLISVPAQARTVPGSYGVSRTQSYCFTDADGQMQNLSSDPTCAVANIRYPLVSDAGSHIDVRVHGFASDAAHNISCQLRTMSNGDDSWVVWRRGPWMSLPRFGAGSQMRLGLDFFSGGAAMLDCNVPTNAWINTVEVFDW